MSTIIVLLNTREHCCLPSHVWWNFYSYHVSLTYCRMRPRLFNWIKTGRQVMGQPSNGISVCNYRLRYTCHGKYTGIRSFSDGICRGWIELIETVVDLIVVIVHHILQKCIFVGGWKLFDGFTGSQWLRENIPCFRSKVEKFLMWFWFFGV